MTTPIKNMYELREFLSSTLLAANTEAMDKGKAEVLANLAGKMITSAKVQADYNQMLGRKQIIGFMEEPDGELYTPGEKQKPKLKSVKKAA